MKLPESTASLRIYLDVCCLNRPFDDQTQDRVHLETEAILLILERCQTGKWQLVGSEVVDFEVSQIPDYDRRRKVSSLTPLIKDLVIVDAEIAERALVFEKAGIKSIDALHLACAEKAEADIFLTTDNRFLQNISKSNSLNKVRVDNPINWLIEVIQK